LLVSELRAKFAADEGDVGEETGRTCGEALAKSTNEGRNREQGHKLILRPATAN